ncbi:hypothetical protein C8F04DRAFT_483921 [Mycena alexandri]|uniref:Uncharacterized protein n=1 Tax=Mycena alexandri TaxID=1745969 RepID=A0AAD6SYU0_9AGAR|nr:hypothetical protein C8F04DRAFT_483921 [Mycena alexandri]
MRRFHLSPQLYSWIWIPAALVPTSLAVYTVYLLDPTEHSVKTFFLGLLRFFGYYFTEDIFGLWRIIFTVILLVATTLYVWLSAVGEVPCFMWIGITLASDFLLWTIDWYVVGAEEFQHYMLGEKVVECLRQIAVRDSLPFIALYSWDARWSLFKRYFRYLSSLHLFSKGSYCVHTMWARLKSYFRYPSTGAIALPTNDDLSNSGLELDSSTASRTPQSLKQPSVWARFKLYFCYSSTGPIALPADDEVQSNSDFELGSSSSSSSRAPRFTGHHTPWTPPAQLSKNLTHWSMLASEWDTRKALWVTADSANMWDSIAGVTSDLFSPSVLTGSSGVAIVDLSQAESVHWPLIHGLALASREYRIQLGNDPPEILSETYATYPFSRAFDTTTWYLPPSYHYDDDKVKSHHRLFDPPYKPGLQRAHQEGGEAKKEEEKR